ncbi:putative conjugative transfer protein [Escherichia coli]|nr:putative conjugative transfer protein [Escherichia coli]
MATMDSKYIQHLRKISTVLLMLISRTLKLFPFGLVMVARYIILFCT